MPQIQYIVADGNAYAIDETGYMFGAPVFKDNSVDWEHSYEFEPCEEDCLLYTSPSPRDSRKSRMPSSA